MVCEQRNRRPARPARLVAALLAFAGWLGVPPVSQAQLVTELSERAIAVGERVAYVITIDHEEPADVSVRVPDFPGLRVVEGPTIRPVSILSGSGRERAIEVRFTLEATRAGRYVLPSVPVSVAGQPYLTEPRLLEIGERRNRQRVPFLARWSGTGRSLYAGEASVFTLEIYNVPEYLYPSSITLDAPENAIMEEVQGLGSIDQYSIDDVSLYSIPVAVFMVTPSQAGTLVLPEATISTGELTAVAAPRSIEVRPLPGAVESSGAVGSFTYDVALEPASLLANETTRLSIRVSGTGNLHFLALPEPVIEGFRIEDDSRTSSLTPLQHGYEGWTERVLTLRPTDESTYRVEGGIFVSLDPVTSAISRQRAQLPAPTVLRANEPVAIEGQVTTLEPLDAAGIGAMERRSWYDDPLAYGWLVPGLLVFVATRIWKRRDAGAAMLVVCVGLLLTDAAADRLRWTDIDRGLARYRQGDLPSAIYAFEDAVRATPDSAAINYNLAVLHFKSGDTPRAAFAAREAVRLAPLQDLPRGLLATIERSKGIERSVAPPHLVHPDLFFLALAVLVNAFFAGAALTRGRRRSATVIAGILLVLLIAGSATGLATSALCHEHQIAVVREGITLRRVPGVEADGWLAVESGSGVTVVATHGGSVLVRTDLGLEGWVSVTDLIWTGSPASMLARYRGFVL